MPSKSGKQHRLMAAAAHDRAFAAKVGISQKVAKEFVAADKGKTFTKESPPPPPWSSCRFGLDDDARPDRPRARSCRRLVGGRLELESVTMIMRHVLDLTLVVIACAARQSR